MQSTLSSGETGTPRFLVSSGRNHDPKDWASATAQQIFDTDSLQGDRKLKAGSIQVDIAEALIKAFDAAIQDERWYLENEDGHVDTPYDFDIFLADAIEAIQHIDAGEWTAKLAGREWVVAASEVIGSNMASAVHIERLYFVQDNPTILAGQRYLARFHQEN